jgi:hypothetical protein
LDLEASDKRGGLPIYGSVFADDDGYHITPEIAAILARGFGKKHDSLAQSVNGTDATKLTYGAVMLLREEIRQAMVSVPFLAEPLIRMAMMRQIKRERRVKQILRTQLHAMEAVHGPCPKSVRGKLWHQSVWKSTPKEIIFESEYVMNDGRVARHRWRWKYVKLNRPVGNKGTKLRREYDAWMKKRIRKAAAPTH